MTAQLDVEALVGRLRKGRLIAPSETFEIEGYGWGATGETRELPHPDARAAADALETLSAHIAGEDARVAAAVAGERERIAARAEDFCYLIDIDRSLEMTKREHGAYALNTFAAAIRETPSA